MKDDLKTTKKLCEGDKITLKDYYSNLPNATHPKTEFINEVIKKTVTVFYCCKKLGCIWNET